MSFKKLLTALEAGETETAMELARSLEGDFNANVDEIGKLETKASEAINGRDKVKAKLRSLAEGVGVDELTVETLLELKSKRGSDSDLEVKHKAELEKLTKTIEDMEADYTGKLTSSNSKYQDALIDKELLKIGVSANAASDTSLEDIMRHLKSGVAIEDGAITYRDSEGVPIRNDKGRPLTLAENIEALKEVRPYLFKPQGKGGSGEPHVNSVKEGSKTRGSMTHDEKAKFITANGEEAFFKLPK